MSTSYGIECNADSNTLKVLGFKSEVTYRCSSLYRLIRSTVLKRDERRCQSLLCESRLAGNPRPATDVLFLHKSLGSYLGLGIANIFAVCPDCSARFADLPPDGVFFALSGLRKRRGHARADIGKWYGRRFEANRTLAKALLADLGERNQKFVVSLLNRRLLPEFYREYLGLGDAANVAHSGT